MNTILTNPYPYNQSSTTRSLKPILKALGGATVLIGATFSLFLTSAQAASFVTTFTTDQGDVTLEWSGEDANSDETIDATELSGPVTLGFGGVEIDFVCGGFAFQADFVTCSG